MQRDKPGSRPKGEREPPRVAERICPIDQPVHLPDRPQIARRRLVNLLVARSGASAPREVVQALGAVQAQDFSAGLWAVGLRAKASRAAVEESVARGEIVRTWLLRGTLHFAAAEDAGWIAALVGPALIKAAASRLRNFELDAATLARAGEILVRALSGHRRLPRGAATKRLDEAGIATARGRGLQILWVLSLQRTICLAAREGHQPTVALFDEWMPRRRALAGDEARAELAGRYFRSHGPATVADFA